MAHGTDKKSHRYEIVSSWRRILQYGDAVEVLSLIQALLLAILSMATPSSLAQDDYQDYQDYANDYANQDNLYTDYAQKQQEKAGGGGGGYVLWQFPYLIFLEHTEMRLNCHIQDFHAETMNEISTTPDQTPTPR
eukprot:scaffold55259_cov58-Attheya_sp.AAC.3